MTLAVNDAGDVLTDASGAWKPAMRAVNDQTGENLVLDGGAWKPMPGAKVTPSAENQATAPDLGTMTEYGPSYAAAPPSEPAPGNAAVERIGNAAGKAFMGTENILRPAVEEAINQTGTPVERSIGRYITNPAIHAVDIAHGGFNAGMAALSQTAMELFGEKGGRDLLAFASSLPMAPEAGQLSAMRANSPGALAKVPAPEVAGAPSAEAFPQSVPLGELDTRNAIQTLLEEQIRNENPDRAPGVGAANQGTPVGSFFPNGMLNRGAIAEIGAAQDVDTAIAAAGRASQETYTPVTAPQVAARDGLGIDAAYARARDENAAGVAPQPAPAANANAPMPEFRSAGAAASREEIGMPLPPEAPAQVATSLQKMVNQSAVDRLTPEGRDDAVYVPGVERPEAMRDFSPAPEGELSTALAHKALYNTDTNYHDQFDALVKKNNDTMVDRLGDLMGDANARDAAMNDAKALMPGPIGLFDEQRPVDAQPIEDRIHEILNGPAGKRSSVRTLLTNIADNLRDANGDLETMPSMLKGVRDDITDRLYDKTPTTEGNAARTARNQLQDVLGVVDETIGSGLPGTKYQDYLANLSAALGRVSKLDFLQQYLTGPKKLTDLAGNLQFNKVQRMLEDINAHHADLTGGAKELSAPEIHQIEAVRNELAAKDLLDRRAAVRGSPTAQLVNASGTAGSGPLGAGVKGAAEVALHMGLAPLTGGLGNAALAGYRFIYKPAVEAARAREAAATLAATKQRLLDTTPASAELR